MSVPGHILPFLAVDQIGHFASDSAALSKEGREPIEKSMPECSRI